MCTYVRYMCKGCMLATTGTRCCHSGSRLDTGTGVPRSSACILTISTSVPRRSACVLTFGTCVRDVCWPPLGHGVLTAVPGWTRVQVYLGAVHVYLLSVQVYLGGVHVYLRSVHV